MKINICSTKERNVDGFISVDIVDNADIMADLSKPWPFEDNSIDQIRAFDAIEHLPDKIFTMNEAYRVLTPGGIIDIFVPSTDGRGAWQDPTHVSYWNQNSFMYYATNFPEYLKLCKQYGFNGQFKIEYLQTTPKDQSEVCHVKCIMKKV
jgi:predicted SAM-dependent methyltransferase